LASIKSPKKSTQLDVQKRAGFSALGASPAPDKGTPPCRKQNAPWQPVPRRSRDRPPGACNPSGIALSVVEACREICEHKPTASTAHDPAIPLMVYQLASVRVEVGTHEVASWDRGRNLSAYSLSHQANIAGFAVRSFVPRWRASLWIRRTRRHFAPQCEPLAAIEWKSSIPISNECYRYRSSS
jgi:hypothetical protein